MVPCGSKLDLLGKDAWKYPVVRNLTTYLKTEIKGGRLLSFHTGTTQMPSQDALMGDLRAMLPIIGRLIFIHHQCWEVLPFSTIQRQRCIKILCPKDPEFYTLLALNCQKGEHLPAPEVYKKQSPNYHCQMRSGISQCLSFVLFFFVASIFYFFVACPFLCDGGLGSLGKFSVITTVSRQHNILRRDHLLQCHDCCCSGLSDVSKSSDHHPMYFVFHVCFVVDFVVALHMRLWAIFAESGDWCSPSGDGVAAQGTPRSITYWVCNNRPVLSLRTVAILPLTILNLFGNCIGRREKTPTPKTRFSSWTLLRTPGRFTTRPLTVYFTTKMSVVRPIWVLSKDEIGP